MEKSGDITVVSGEQTAVMCDMNALYAFEGGEAIATLDDGTCVGVREKIGEGEIVWLAANAAQSEMQESIWSNRRQPIPPRVEAQASLRACLLYTSEMRRSSAALCSDR